MLHIYKCQWMYANVSEDLCRGNMSAKAVQVSKVKIASIQCRGLGSMLRCRLKVKRMTSVTCML